MPDPLRVVNLDKTATKFADVTNFPSDCLYTEKEVEEHDKIRQQEMAKQQAPALAMAGVNAAKTLSETDIGGNSALAALTGAPVQ